LKTFIDKLAGKLPQSHVAEDLSGKEKKNVTKEINTGSISVAPTIAEGFVENFKHATLPVQATQITAYYNTFMNMAKSIRHTKATNYTPGRKILEFFNSLLNPFHDWRREYV